MPDETEARGLLEVAARFVNPSGYSMTMAREEAVPAAEATSAEETPDPSDERPENG
jgi:hypothetical protein